MTSQLGGPRTVKPSFRRWSRSAATLLLRSPVMIAVVAAAAALYYTTLSSLGMLAGVAAVPLAVCMAAALAARADARVAWRWGRVLRCAALSSAPTGLVFGLIALYLQASGQPPLPGKQSFDGLWTVGLYVPLQLVIASGSVWAFLLMTMDDLSFVVAGRLASKGHSLNASWLWLLVVAVVFVVIALRGLPILSLPFAAFVGAFEYVTFREVFWGITEDSAARQAESSRAYSAVGGRATAPPSALVGMHDRVGGCQ